MFKLGQFNVFYCDLVRALVVDSLHSLRSHVGCNLSMCRLCYITKEQERRDYLVFIGILFILPRASKHHSHAPGSDVARDRDPVRQRPLLLPLRDVAMVS